MQKHNEFRLSSRRDEGGKAKCVANLDFYGWQSRDIKELEKLAIHASVWLEVEGICIFSHCAKYDDGWRRQLNFIQPSASY